MARKLSYGEAINDAHRLALINDDKCFVIGQGVNNPWFVGKTTTGLMDEFGPRGIMDSPVSEAAMTGACIGAAMAGMHPIVFHPRMDFMYLALAFPPKLARRANGGNVAQCHQRSNRRADALCPSSGA